MNALIRFPLGLLLLIYQSLMLALSQVWSNKVRSILTTIGIVIGVASVSTVIAALDRMTHYVLENFEQLGINKVFIYPQDPQHGRMRGSPMVLFEPYEFDGILEHCPSLKAYTRMTEASLNISYRQRSDQNVPVQGVDKDWLTIENRPLEQGRPFSVMDIEKAKSVCLINQALREKLSLPHDCTDCSIIINQQRFHVIGLLETRPAGMFTGSETTSEVTIPFTTLYTMRGGRTFIHVEAASRSPNVSEEAQAEINFFLRQKRHIHPGEPDTFNVQFVSQFVDQFKKIAGVLTSVAIGIVSISLLVGGVGIMNIMLVSVSERTREIGLRKAVGARPAAILLQFLVEAIFLCCFGGALGLGIAQLLTIAMGRIATFGLQGAYIPGWAIALSFGFSATVGLIFGMFPAIKAARLDPIEALRHE